MNQLCDAMQHWSLVSIAGDPCAPSSEQLGGEHVSRYSASPSAAPARRKASSWRRIIFCLAMLYVIGVAVEFAGYVAAY